MSVLESFGQKRGDVYEAKPSMEDSYKIQIRMLDMAN